MIFLMIVPLENVCALTCLSRTKSVSIDADWKITGQYTRDFEISHPDDEKKINSILQQFEKPADSLIRTRAEVCRPDGRYVSWKTDTGNELPVGATVRLTAVIARDFPGFESLFADYLRIDQDIPVKTAAYRITFPQKMTYTCRINQNGIIRQHTAQSDSFAWAGSDITRLDLTISTATSWEQIAGRYQAHFQSRLGDGLAKKNFPDILRHIDRSDSPDETIQSVMNFLKNGLEYRTSPLPDHALLPDSPAAVLRRGWGDCKDFALLAAALLQKMDIETSVVLAGTPRINEPGDIIPDPFIFDHALIGFHQDGETAYYDCLIPGNIVTVNDHKIYLSLNIFNPDN